MLDTTPPQTEQAIDFVSQRNIGYMDFELKVSKSGNYEILLHFCSSLNLLILDKAVLVAQ